jgi:hypothetical protein
MRGGYSVRPERRGGMATTGEHVTEGNSDGPFRGDESVAP